ncbi:MAG: hypothetical protein OEY23_12860, partial [Acidimicrobiia bacterium]|nr:hypothetical protein [Acidimicrobiia bacterium]
TRRGRRQLPARRRGPPAPHAGWPQRPAPRFGEHTDDILRRLLALSDDELDELRVAGITATTPGPQTWR